MRCAGPISRLLALGLLMFLVAVYARAADSKFSLTVQADGVSLATVAATLNVEAAQDGMVTWKFADGVFTALPNPDGSVNYAEDVLTGTGKIKATGNADLKDFDVTVQQATGVDVTYRFRISATLADGAVKSVSIAKVD
jgi:hypothetical protein